jgi:DNA-binding Lrp family transcriptional regulator
MNELPQAIKDALEKIRQSHKHYVDIKVINGRCYAYESTSVWDKKLKKIRKITKYIGRITEQGEFISSNPRNTELSGALIKERQNEGKSRSVGTGKGYEAYEPGRGMGKYDQAILRNLSMNGRMTIPFLAKKLRISANATRYQLGKIEEKYGIRYIAELDVEKLGYLNYITFVKFKRPITDFAYIRDALEKEPQVQVVLFTRGIYGMVIFSLAKSSRDIAQLTYRLLSTTFKDYVAKWYTSSYYSAYNFIPLRERFFTLLEERIWKRTKEETRPRAEGILYRDYVLLKELSSNGVMDFTEIDEKYKLNSGTAQYAYHKLKKDGVITRITISMQSLPIKYNAILIGNILNGEGFAKTYSAFLNNVVEENNMPYNKYVISGDIETPKSILFVMPVLNDRDLEHVEEQLKNAVKGMKLDSLIITEVALGYLCYRKFDNSYSKHYIALRDKDDTKPAAEKEIYE